MKQFFKFLKESSQNNIFMSFYSIYWMELVYRWDCGTFKSDLLSLQLAICNEREYEWEDLSTKLTWSSFQYVGSMEIPRPGSRIEIVAAMRRVRVSLFFTFIISIIKKIHWNIYA